MSGLMAFSTTIQTPNPNTPIAAPKAINDVAAAPADIPAAPAAAPAAVAPAAAASPATAVPANAASAVAAEIAVKPKPFANATNILIARPPIETSPVNPYPNELIRRRSGPAAAITAAIISLNRFCSSVNELKRSTTLSSHLANLSNIGISVVAIACPSSIKETFTDWTALSYRILIVWETLLNASAKDPDDSVISFIMLLL